MDPTMLSPRVVHLPIGTGIDIPIPTGPHFYRTKTWVGRASDGITPTQAMQALLRHATPLQRRVAEDGKTTDIPILGSVRHRVDPERRMVVNTTEPGHWLDPGNVHRSIVQDGDDIYVQSDGYGTGSFPEINKRLAEFLWPLVDEDIRRELIEQDLASRRGPPDSQSVFELRFPEEMRGRPVETAGAETNRPTREPQAITRAQSVFETGTAPFVQSPSMFAGLSRGEPSVPLQDADRGVSPTTFQDRFGASTAPPPGGLPGLLASVAGIDPANPFRPAPPVDKVPVRRLIGRPAE
ncbi:MULTISPECIES: hypothetical protein [unclassified Bradyrhizobium]|uniref:hypothetical protein n=1 Tax=unclassified Bradyrhizobium TaxID=2631580 RepID=UPI0028E72347|nr:MULTISPECIES: hypothetical protein [unclassified Bradyrhizobium]